MSTATVLFSNNDDPAVDIVTVTPEWAKRVLAQQNNHNRSLREAAIADYARDMAAGKWRLNGEALKLAKDGTVLDGQHRIAAVIQADVPVRMFIVTGLEMETQETMDSGRKRTVGDMFALRGEANATVLAAVVRKKWFWEQGDIAFSGRAQPTSAECAEVLGRFPGLRRSAAVAAHVQQHFGYLPQSVTGLAHHLFSRIDEYTAESFFTRLAIGADLGIDSPILTLRSRAMADRANQRSVPNSRSLAYLIRTWNAVRMGKQLTRIQQGPDDAMPMPK